MGIHELIMACIPEIAEDQEDPVVSMHIYLVCEDPRLSTILSAQLLPSGSPLLASIPHQFKDRDLFTPFKRQSNVRKMTLNPTITTAIQPPPGPATKLSLPSTASTTNDNLSVFNDAMKIRVRVFVDEQRCSARAEIDSDDPRSWQWVIYGSSLPTTSPIPVGVIRLVPPPQLPQEILTHPNHSATPDFPAYDWVHEPCVKLTRVAVMPEYRGLGLGRRLVDTALDWASRHAVEIDEAIAQLARESHWTGTYSRWQGLVLVHAQVDVERMYKALGFETEESLGRWYEEGIEHVGMYRRIEVARSAGGR